METFGRCMVLFMAIMLILSGIIPTIRQKPVWWLQYAWNAMIALGIVLLYLGLR